ncbi:PIR protein [Plasmodium ovale]|nr:PIR protein [Plasmodium ovale]
MNEENSYCKSIETHIKNYNGLDDLCKRIARNFKEYSTLLSNEKGNDADLYLTYWIISEIKRVLNYNFKSTSYDVIKKLLFVGNMNYYETQNKKFFFSEYDYDLNDWVEMKDLHDYFKNFEKFIEKLYSNSGRCERYFSYLNHIKTLYEKHNTNCCVIYFDCAEYFKCEEKI